MKKKVNFMFPFVRKLVKHEWLSKGGYLWKTISIITNFLHPNHSNLELKIETIFINEMEVFIIKVLDEQNDCYFKKKDLFLYNIYLFECLSKFNGFI
jgi:hypothetical protein